MNTESVEHLLFKNKKPLRYDAEGKNKENKFIKT
jgi:hypothetical protein